MAAARLSIGKAILFWLLAIVAGPPLGGIGFYLLLILKAVSGLDANSVFPDNDPLATIWAIAVFSYLLGIIPAALAALPLAIVIARFGTVSWQLTAAAALFGAIVAYLLLFGRTGADATFSQLWMFAVLAVPSLLAALICRWLAAAMGLLRPANTG